jgi:formylglycine-generating enzyme required for sulfatase activity
MTTFDLPTEAQWEYACRAGTASYYSDGVSTSAETNILNRIGWWTGNSGGSTHAVGGKEPNAWGLYDTQGNVWEWCLDWNGTLPGGEDPAGNSAGTYRIGRGGDFGSAASTCRASFRLANSDTDPAKRRPISVSAVVAACRRDDRRFGLRAHLLDRGDCCTLSP